MAVKLVNLSKGADYRHLIICCPHAGGSPNQYRSFAQYLPSTFGLMGVLLPGRDGWYNQESPASLREASQELCYLINRHDKVDLIFFGHSMGALLAYEAARCLDGDVKHLFVSGHVAPHICLPNHRRHTLDDQALKQVISELSGTPREIVENDELMELLLPTIRQDFMLCDTYQFQDAATQVLTCPITAFGGIDDSRMYKEGVDAWSQYTSVDFQAYRFTGDHFFVFDHAFSIVQKLVQRIEELNTIN